MVMKSGVAVERGVKRNLNPQGVVMWIKGSEAKVLVSKGVHKPLGKGITR